MFRKPSTLIAGAIKLGYYTDMRDSEDCSQFMCHAIHHAQGGRHDHDNELVNQTVQLIEEKLVPFLPVRSYHSVTLHEVLIRIDKMDPDSEPSFERKLQFWKEFIKELKAKGL